MLISGAELDTVVRDNPKQRFTLDAARNRIRANQGHIVPVDLGLIPVVPPAVLYHGTSRRRLSTILEEGLRPWAADTSTCPPTPAPLGPSEVDTVRRSSSSSTAPACTVTVVVLIGRLTADPQSHAGEKHESATFRLAVPRKPTPTKPEVSPGAPDNASIDR